MTLPTPTPPYSQEHVGKGKYQLINNYTYQFVAVTAHGARSICRGTTGARCTDYLKIGVTEYSGNTQVTVAPKEFALVSAAGNRYGPAPVREASRVVPAFEVLRTQVLHPDDDGDYATGTLVFLVPPGAGRFSLQWRGHHVATFVKPTRGKLFETR